VENLFARVGTFDWLVLAMSGSADAGPLEALDLDGLRDAFDAKFWGHLTSVQVALPYLAAQSSITFISASSARAGIPATSGLAAINGAVEALVKPLAVELAPIRVNAVSPGLVDTPWWSALPAETRAAYFAQAEKVLPVRRVASADGVAESVVLVATNPNLTGTVIESDGGARLVSLV
jgi:NAD(P)-dependent dehydrogenase (short-subunit alcohol dehydrogenase family)